MPLSAGSCLGPYEILDRIGAGGMGEVYKARDTRLDRVVAIKVSQERFSQRFQHEARAIAALNHPHICTLHDVGPDYIVMEYVEGKPVKGPLPLQKSLEYAAQICDALDAAHRKGVIHRDLKPSNILLTRQGVKVVDFGLAKLSSEDTQTQTGVRVGTPGYMAPEQWDGRSIDARTDIFALGHVLLEMITGSRAVQEPLDSPALNRVVQTCIAAEPEERWQSAREVKLALEMVSSASSPTPPRVSWRRMTAVGAITLLCAAALAWALLRPRSYTEEPVRLSLLPPPDANFTESGFALSPDGRTVVFVAERGGRDSLWVRPLASLVAREIPGTEGASYPFWSPDSSSLGFFQHGKLKQAPSSGGVPTTICDAVNTRGGSWGGDGVIVFAPTAGGGLQRVAARGGKPEFLTRLNAERKESEHRWPHFLPDGKRFLYWVQSSNSENTGIYVSTVDPSIAPVHIMPSDRLAEYATGLDGVSGLLVSVRGESLLAQRFDLQGLRLLGEPVTISDTVAISGLGYAHFSAPAARALIFGSTTFGRRRMQWRSRDGKPIAEEGPADVYYTPDLSPDGGRIAVTRVSSAVNSDIWVYERARGVMDRITDAPGVDNYAVWSPDGLKLAFTSARQGPRSLYLTDARSAGRGREERLTNAQFNHELLDWSSDGRYLVYRENHPVSHSDIYLLPMQSPPPGRQPEPLLKTAFDEIDARFSPDVRSVAYVSNESGEYEVYVQPIPKGARIPVSNHGGSAPRWRRDGKELFYISPQRMLMSVDVATDAGGLRFSTPREVFLIPHRSNVAVNEYDVSADGKRFFVLAPIDKEAAAPLTVVLNWQSALRR